MKSLSLLSLSALTLGAPVLNAETQNSDRWLVVLKQDLGIVPSSILNDHVGDANIAKSILRHEWTINSYHGFAASLTDAQLESLKADERVEYLEPDGIAHTTAIVQQSNVPWGLARLSSRSAGGSVYQYDDSAGEGACAYIIDTGITPGLAEFEGRAASLKSFISGATNDDNGHGTHVAGTIGSKTYGVAKKAKLFGIKVLDSSGSGSYSDIIAGISYAVQDSKQRSCPKGFVINMSLGGSTSQSLNDASAAAVDAGIFIAAAAGNEADDYRNSSPASESKVFAVGASDKSDNLASFSNYGTALGVIAPGVDVASTWYDGSIKSISGTSMASPHVAGLAAYLGGLSSNGLSPAEIKSQIQSLATSGAVALTRSASRVNTPNLLAFNGAS